jgi:hypothetical protein
MEPIHAWASSIAHPTDETWAVVVWIINNSVSEDCLGQLWVLRRAVQNLDGVFPQGGLWLVNDHMLQSRYTCRQYGFTFKWLAVNHRKAPPRRSDSSPQKWSGRGHQTCKRRLFLGANIRAGLIMQDVDHKPPRTSGGQALTSLWGANRCDVLRMLHQKRWGFDGAPSMYVRTIE